MVASRCQIQVLLWGAFWNFLKNIFDLRLVVSVMRNLQMWNAICTFFFFFKWAEDLFIYLFLLCWVFVSVRGLPLVVASGGHSSSHCAGLSPSRPLPLRSTGSRRAGSATVANGPSRSAARGILPGQGPNLRLLH